MNTAAQSVLATAAACLAVGYRPLWERTRYVVTVIHEGGHGIAALLTGRRLNGIRLHRDTSGATLSTGGRHGITFTALAGYLSPSVVGVVVAFLIAGGLSVEALAGALVVLFLVLLYIRNFFGVLVVAVCGLAVAMLIWRAPPQTQILAGYAISAFLVVGAMRDSCALWIMRRRGSRNSDADVLARNTHVPAALWNLAFIVFNMLGVLIVIIVQFRLDTRLPAIARNWPVIGQ